MHHSTFFFYGKTTKVILEAHMYNVIIHVCEFPGVGGSKSLINVT